MKTKEIIKSGLQLFTILVVIHFANSFDIVNAATLPILEGAKEEFIKGDIIVPPDAEGLTIAEQLVFGALGYVKALMVAIGILFITITGMQLIMANGDEESITKSRKAIIYTIIGFVIISMSQEFARVFDMKDGTIISSPQEILNRYRLFDRQVQVFVTFVKYVIGAYAALFAVRSGIGLITSGANEEERGKYRNSLMYSAGGLFLLYVGQIFIEKVFYKIDKNVYSGVTGVHPSIDAKAGVDQIAGITNLVVSFVGPVAVLVFIVGAVMYATAAGEEERMEQAKKLLISSVIGIVIIYASFAIVSTVLASKLTDLGALIE